MFRLPRIEVPRRSFGIQNGTMTIATLFQSMEHTHFVVIRHHNNMSTRRKRKYPHTQHLEIDFLIDRFVIVIV